MGGRGGEDDTVEESLEPLLWLVEDIAQVAPDEEHLAKRRVVMRRGDAARCDTVAVVVHSMVQYRTGVGA